MGSASDSLSMVCTMGCVHTILQDVRSQFKVSSPAAYREFTDLFVQVVRLAREIGLVKLDTIAVDSTKIKVNASRQLWVHANHKDRAQSPN